MNRVRRSIKLIQPKREVHLPKCAPSSYPPVAQAPGPAKLRLDIMMGEKVPEPRLSPSEANGIIHEARVEWAKRMGRTECRMALTAVDRRTRKLSPMG